MYVKRILVTGATGKVGRHFIDRFLAEPFYSESIVRALCHERTPPPHERLEVVKGSIADRGVVRAAMKDVTHVVHLATCKETPEEIMDVAVKGLFWLLEECRASEIFRQFLLIGGDASVGHFHYHKPVPVTEEAEHTAYPGCYALSKVLEEVMLEQYYVQYKFNGTCLRAPWIMEKDDFKYTLSFGEDVFGAPRWRKLVGADIADDYAKSKTVPLAFDANWEPLRRNFVHVSDLVEAMMLVLENVKANRQTFNISMDEPVDYRKVAEHLHKTRELPWVDVTTEHHSTWLDNSKAKLILGWRPQYDLARLIEEAFEYKRTADDPRKIWYPG